MSTTSARKRKREDGVVEVVITKPPSSNPKQSHVPEETRAAGRGKLKSVPKVKRPAQAISKPVGQTMVQKKESLDMLTKAKKPRQTYGRAGSEGLKTPKATFSPGVLPAMLGSDSDKMDDAFDRSPSPPPSARPVSRKSVDNAVYDTLPSTPPRPSSESANPLPGSTAPEQNGVKARLQNGTGTTYSPSALPIRRLRISDPLGPKSPGITKVRSDLVVRDKARKVRLIDTLIQDAPNEDSEMNDSFDVPMDDGTNRVETNSFSAISSQSSQDQSQKASQEGTPRTKRTTMAAIPGKDATLTNVGPRITYAKQRSYLEEETLEKALLLDGPVPPVNGLGGGPDQGAKAASQSQSLFSQDEDLEDSQGQIRSVHELRAAGGNKRFIDEVDAVMEDMESKGAGSLSRRRSAIMELCSKLEDEKFAKRFLDHAFDRRICKSLTGTTDEILGFAAAVVIILLIQADAPALCIQGMYETGLLDVLLAMLDVDKHITRVAKERRVNMSKMAQSSLAEFADMVKDFVDWDVDDPPDMSPRNVALKAIDALLMKLRHFGNKQPLFDDTMVSKLLEIIRKTMNVDTAPAAAQFSQMHILSILELASVASIPEDSETLWSSSTLRSITSILPALLVPDPDPVTGLAPEPDASIETTISRLTVNLTNNNPTACKLFSDSAVVQAFLRSMRRKFAAIDAAEDEDERAETVDRLILATGAMINLAECEDNARKAALDDDGTLLGDLIASFLEGRKKAEKVRLAHISNLQSLPPPFAPSRC
ncbi:wings apart-like protein regulation of heterochromatin-domain-containing protein [Lineolata rhizophorae]|uniref:Wings apart-like protein regulation of heterochromatin-domain-containing protein n=1 Tax=Lineolata rhizophorae TaxID=578093 RepID=A0A6A6NM50_9PEZI|nr:wings apart-like protein regulation of heterochromatin-domain-containing protein [Lineolata rhizophorae]